MTDTQDADGREDDCLFEPLDTHYSHLAEAKVLVDLRRHPRFDTHFSAEASSESGRKSVVTITNVSHSGLRLEANRHVLDDLFPDFSRKTRYTPTTLRVHFAVPGGSDGHLPVQVQCRSVYVRREKQDTWQIGMKFVEFAEGNEALTEYLLRSGKTE